MTEEKKRIGEILLEAGLIDEFQLATALGRQKQWGGKLASILINMGFVDEKSVASALEKQLGQKCLSFDNREISQEVVDKVKPEIVQKCCIMPIEFDQKTLTLAISDPTDLKTLDELEFMLGVRIKPVLALESSIKKAITRYYPNITFSDINIYHIDTAKLSEKLSENFDLMRFEKTMPDISYPHEVIIEALVELLIEKDVIKKEDLNTKIRKKQHHD